MSFDKSSKYLNNYYISKGDKTIYLHKAEIGDLLQNIRAAVDPDVDTTCGGIVLKCGKVSDNASPTEVKAGRNSVKINNGIYRPGVDNEVELSYGEAIGLVNQIENRLVKNAIVRSELSDH